MCYRLLGSRESADKAGKKPRDLFEGRGCGAHLTRAWTCCCGVAKSLGGAMPDEPTETTGHCGTDQHLLPRRRGLKYRTLCSEGELHLIQGFHLLSKILASIGPASQTFKCMESL